MADGMMRKFKKYWGTPDKMNLLIYIASVLDPRNKFVYVSFGLEELFGEENEKKVDKQVKAYMEILFEDYLRKYSKESQYQSSLSRSTLSDLSDLSDSSSSCSQNSRTKVLRTKLHMKKQKKNSGSGAAKSELKRYLKEDQDPEHDDFDVLGWWKVNALRFPILLELARDVLAIPISSVALKCAFSTGGRILDRFKSSLTPKCVLSLVCAQDWLRKEPNSICVEEKMTNSGRDSCIVDKHLESLAVLSAIATACKKIVEQPFDWSLDVCTQQLHKVCIDVILLDGRWSSYTDLFSCMDVI
ncbi:hypothetical protein KY290_001520 [Solanum tuberosum]|uniref:Transposase n=1 Tax=Solanum tuberosum TaxID=4113 RepID=A0ABQ7WPP5_SOLTU|nr:hypothetical protein KY290_001520 [Solanum tuberosum]